MTWPAYHHRAEVLRAVGDEADRRRDGVLPMHLPGVVETFGDELGLVAALQLRWHTRLAGRIEQALMEQPADPEAGVIRAWRDTAVDLPGIREILDAHSRRPSSEQMRLALTRAGQKDWALMAAMAGHPAAGLAAAERVGRRIEGEARAACLVG